MITNLISTNILNNLAYRNLFLGTLIFEFLFLFLNKQLMYTVLVLHNLLRWAVLLFGLLTIVKAIGGLSSNRLYNNGDNKVNLFFMISCDIQLIIGVALFIKNGWFNELKTGMANVMKDPYDRFFSVEHAAMMILAWILVHIGRTSVKRAATDRTKHRKSLIFFGVALLLILASIPWPFRDFINRPYFRAF